VGPAGGGVGAGGREEWREERGEAAPDPGAEDEGLWGAPGTPPAAEVPSSAPRGLPGPEVCPTVAEGCRRRQLGPQRKMARRGPEVILHTCRGGGGGGGGVHASVS